MPDYWIKYYIEILDDPKMATLPDRLWRRTSELFLLAGKFGKQGYLPETRQLAWVLRMNADDLDLDLRQIAATGIIQKTPDGWFVVNFAKRQAPVPPAVRMKKSRERKRKEQYYADDNGDVTNLLRNETQINRLTDNRLTDTDNVTPLTDAFVKAANILPHDLDKWTDAEQTMTRAGVLPVDVEYAVKKMDNDGLTYAGLWSVTNTAIWVKSRREKHQPIFADDKPGNGRAANRPPIQGV